MASRWIVGWGALGVLVLAACSGSGDSSSGNVSTSRGLMGTCYGEEGQSCAGDDAYEQCLISKCDAQYQQCAGAGYKSGAYGGVCGSTIDCVMKCACNDTACEMKCYGSISEECKSCIEAVDTCEQSSGCVEPTCGAAGSGGAGGSTGGGGSGAGDLGGSGGAMPTVCPYEAATLSCVDACANLKLIAAKCQNDPNLSQNTKAILAAAATGTGNGCKVTCASDSPSYGQQWRCFQATPVDADCTAIAGCTVVNCPNPQ